MAPNLRPRKFRPSFVAEEEPPSKKPAIEPTINLLALPEDLVLCCLARVSRLYYPTLSLVSNTFRSLTSSPELYQTRSLFNRTENCIYVCLQFPTEPNLRWFTLCRKPDKTLNNHTTCKKKKKKTENSSGNVLAPVRILNSPPPHVEWSNLVAVGHRLYAIISDDVPCPSSFFFLDCRTHTWVETPSLRLAHTLQVSDGDELDGMMYLAEGYENPESLNCVEVFDVKTQTWNPVPPEKRIFRAKDFQGKACKNRDRLSFPANIKDSTLGFVGPGAWCLIGRVLCLYDSYEDEFKWWDSDEEIDCWREVKGLEGLPKFSPDCNVYSIDCGGKMVVFWDKYVPSRAGYKEKMIWCAEISLEMRSNEEVWGKVEWMDAVLKVPKSYKFVYASAATL
ncbi:hypothetical protein Bca52824_070060 [Brassica carinata]|uniref:F-box domain-containing protein n=1 Tax=Brassica carinata TaxID=52824 RepID=A0A8X7U3H7_BRACI|nr:hypothetical protein Bca52824_070060 [Brassica carinata]